jgi:ferredoxin-NAD(P)+ reductase (naphthalene dioxygenase ferredoxin-specific)
VAFRISLPQSGRTIEAGPEETILAAALREGIAYPHGCQRGRCGSCKSRLLHGAVEMLSHSPFALEPSERQQDLILACRALPASDVMVHWPDAAGAFPPMPPIEAVVAARHEIAPQIHRLVARATRPLTFLPGQYLNVTLPGGVTRSYSPANQPMAQDAEFHIRAVAGGQASSLIARLSVGERVQLSGPFGDAYLRDDADKPVLALAASTGQAPVKSIVDRILSNNDRRIVRVFAFGRELHNLYLARYFSELAMRHTNLGYRSILTSAVQAAPTTPRALIADSISVSRDWCVHIAGPAGFVSTMSAMVRNLGCDDVLTDSF